LGRSELEATYSNENINKTGTNKSLSITRRNNNDGYNHTSHSLLEDDDDSDQIRMDNDDQEDDYSQGERLHRENSANEISGNASVTQGNITGRDSPDFNRHGNSTYDLTVSNTVVSNQNATYRAANELTKRGGSTTNRTFADSVINH
jgi:hypothetical protein